MMASYDNELEEKIKRLIEEIETAKSVDTEDDSLLSLAVKCVTEAGAASTSILQKHLKVGYARAGRLIDEMEQCGVIGPHMGSIPRKVLITYDEWVSEHGEPADGDHQSQSEISSDELTKIKELLADMPPVQEVYKTKLGIDVDYSDNGFFIEKLGHSIFPKSNDAAQTEFITKLVTYASPDLLHLILIDDGIGYAPFKEIPSLLVPVVSDNKKAATALSWLVSEMKNRLTKFSDVGCKDIGSYNSRVVSEHDKLYHIVVGINEAYSLLNDPRIDDFLVPLLLNSKRTGIYLYLFTKFSLKNLSLGIKADLLKVGDPVDLNHIFTKVSGNTPGITLEDIDNNMSGLGFEKLCGELLQKNGFTNITVTQSSGDYGADVVAIKDGVKYAIQCKKYSSPIGISAIQEVIASRTIYNCHVACVLTNNAFTPAAVELAEKNLVLLWDRTKLKELLDKV